MNRIAKIFCIGKEQAELAKANKTLERYPAFLLIEAPAKRLTEPARRSAIFGRV
jgi:hypothetical protein